MRRDTDDGMRWTGTPAVQHHIPDWQRTFSKELPWPIRCRYTQGGRLGRVEKAGCKGRRRARWMLWEIRHRFLVVCYEFKEEIARGSAQEAGNQWFGVAGHR